MSNKARVQIERINGDPEVYQNEKMKVPKTTFICDGYIDGEAVQDFIVQAFGKKADLVVPGFDFLADIDINPWSKKTQYVVPREMGAPSRSNPPPARTTTSPTRTGQTAGKASAPTSAGPQSVTGGRESHPSGYTLEEYDALFDHATDKITELLTDKDGQYDSDAVSRLVSTYMISAIQLGVRVRPEPTAAQPSNHAATAPAKEETVDMSALVAILEAKGLAKLVDDANISEDVLIRLWKESGASKLKFGILVNDFLKNSGGTADQAGDDNLPF